MNKEQYVYFIDNAIQHEVLDAQACIEAIMKSNPVNAEDFSGGWYF